MEKENCLPGQKLSDYLSNELEISEKTEIETHLKLCSACQEYYHRLQRVNQNCTEVRSNYSDKDFFSQIGLPGIYLDKTVATAQSGDIDIIRNEGVITAKDSSLEAVDNGNINIQSGRTTREESLEESPIPATVARPHLPNLSDLPGSPQKSKRGAKVFFFGSVEDDFEAEMEELLEELQESFGEAFLGQAQKEPYQAPREADIIWHFRLQKLQKWQIEIEVSSLKERELEETWLRIIRSEKTFGKLKKKVFEHLSFWQEDIAKEWERG